MERTLLADAGYAWTALRRSPGFDFPGASSLGRQVPWMVREAITRS